jgi:hypothetical protein
MIPFVFATALAAEPLELSSDGRSLVGSASPEGGYPLPCVAHTLLVREEDAWAGCATAVIHLRRAGEGALEVVGAIPVEGDVVELMQRGPEVWVVRQRRDAIPLRGAGDLPAHGPTDATTAPRVGAVTGEDRSRPVIDLGRRQGLATRDRVEFFEERRRDTPAGPIVEERVIAIGEVVGVSDDAAIVAPGINQSVPLGTLARRTERTMGANTAAPPRVGGQGWVRLNAAGLVSLMEDGGGLLFEGAAGYRFRPPIELSVRVGPGWGGGSDARVSGRVSVVGFLAFDHPYFAIGVGGGASIVEGTPDGVFAQQLRLGAVDGLSLSVTAQFAKTGASRTGWRLDNLDGVAQIPLSRRAPSTWLTLHGNGSSFDGGGDLGVRIRARGNGQHGTLTFWPHIGAQVEYDWVGPAVGLGLDVRL